MRTASVQVCLAFFAAFFCHAQPQNSEKQKTVVILATTDLHGNIFPWDYLTGKAVDRGLGKIASLIREERQKHPDAILIDCGDTIQGAPLESVYQGWVRTGKFPLNLKPATPLKADPMMLAMNYLRYDAMVVGNHEFNFGLLNLENARADARFPWISANIAVRPGSGRKPFAGYALKTVNGVKVAILGITTPAVPSWEKPENFKDYTFPDAKAGIEQALRDARQHKPDLVILAAHAGLERDLKSGSVREGDQLRENMVHQIASEVPGIDAIVFGHTHQQLQDYRLNGVLLTQPKNWGISMAKLTFALEPRPGGGWRVTGKTGNLIPVTASTAADNDVLRIAQPYHDITETYLNSRVSHANSELSASQSRVRDTAIIDAVHAVQLHYSKADVSFTAAFNPRAVIPKGPVTVRQIAALYIYDNELYAIEGNGKMVREALENAAKFFNNCHNSQCSGPLLNRSVIPYNYEMAQGVSYDIDLTQPVGQRIRNLKFKGRPLDDAQTLRVAVNNYRAAGSGGYKMFRGAKLLWRSYDDIRELIIRYYSENPLPANPDGNWRVVPQAAARRLEAETHTDSARPAGNQ